MTRSCLVPEILQLILKSIHFTVMAGGRIEFPLTRNLTRGCAICPIFCGNGSLNGTGTICDLR